MIYTAELNVYRNLHCLFTSNEVSSGCYQPVSSAILAFCAKSKDFKRYALENADDCIRIKEYDFDRVNWNCIEISKKCFFKDIHPSTAEKESLEASILRLQEMLSIATIGLEDQESVKSFHFEFHYMNFDEKQFYVSAVLETQAVNENNGETIEIIDKILSKTFLK